MILSIFVDDACVNGRRNYGAWGPSDMCSSEASLNQSKLLQNQAISLINRFFDPSLQAVYRPGNLGRDEPSDLSRQTTARVEYLETPPLKSLDFRLLFFFCAFLRGRN